MATQEEQKHPANAVFMLLEDRKFRFEVVKPGLAKEKRRLGRLVSGKHQVRGFRNISKAPAAILLPVMAEEANVSPDLAQVLLQHWFEEQAELREKVAGKLSAEGYEPRSEPFDEDGMISWKTMSSEHANQQFDGEFLPDEEDNPVMLMSLLLGWFGAGEEEAEEEAEEKPETKPEPQKKESKKPAAAKKKESGKAKKEPASKSEKGKGGKKDTSASKAKKESASGEETKKSASTKSAKSPKKTSTAKTKTSDSAKRGRKPAGNTGTSSSKKKTDTRSRSGGKSRS